MKLRLKIRKNSIPIEHQNPTYDAETLNVQSLFLLKNAPQCPLADSFTALT